MKLLDAVLRSSSTPTSTIIFALMISKKLASLLAHGLVQQSLALSYFCYSASCLFSEDYKNYTSEKARDLKLNTICSFLTFLVGLWHTIGSLSQLIPLIRYNFLGVCV